MRKILGIILLIYSSASLAQDVDSLNKPSFEMGLGTRLYAPMKIETQGEDFLKSHPTPAPMFFIGWNSKKSKRNLSFSTYLEGSWIGYWYSYDVKVPVGNELYGTHDKIESFRAISLFPGTGTLGCQLLYTKSISQTKRLDFGLGFNASIIPSHSHFGAKSYGYKTLDDTLSLKVFTHETRLSATTIYLNLAASMGYAFRVGKRFHKVNLGLNISNDVVAEGTYAFNLLPSESFGKIYTRNFYTTISYSLLLKKY